MSSAWFSASRAKEALVRACKYLWKSIFLKSVFLPNISLLRHTSQFPKASAYSPSSSCISFRSNFATTSSRKIPRIWTPNSTGALLSTCASSVQTLNPLYCGRPSAGPNFVLDSKLHQDKRVRIRSLAWKYQNRHWAKCNVVPYVPSNSPPLHYGMVGR